ncbi:hypothetical protein LKR43_00715 [Pusillimonas sp. MFBS29]|uniref:acyl-CoA dehydrogenase family protein n=1 Tax=Pusillimonas sp. MFBS29 TaxID=2886690 RepID=UPI001D0F5A14|nr:acyl-CoA dehydrogenase family protein [Pusillimonas sp. MFBS29]MCC2594857.1 hypothetical protein [Pusillimonas sp. MFBS29]
MNEIDQMLNDSAIRFFTDLCTRDVLDEVERGVWLQEPWQDMQAMGLTSAAVMDTDDIDGNLGLKSLGLLARQAGRFNLPLPLVETFMAHRALRTAGIPVDEDMPIGMSTLCSTSTLTAQQDGDGYIVDGKAGRVAWGRHCPWILATGSKEGKLFLALLPAATRVQPGVNLAGEPRDTLHYENVRIDGAHLRVLETDELLDQIICEGALFRCMQLTGAMQRALEMTIEYAREREQFGRPIAKFQAIQHQIAEQAAQTASATAAADAAAHASRVGPARLEIAMAKIRCSEAATVVYRVAHQVHGAMGFTHEHNLHLTTRRLMSWRDEFGSDDYWAQWLGATLSGMEEGSIWPFITDPAEALNQGAA